MKFYYFQVGLYFVTLCLTVGFGCAICYNIRSVEGNGIYDKYVTFGM